MLSVLKVDSNLQKKAAKLESTSTATPILCTKDQAVLNDTYSMLMFYVYKQSSNEFC